MKKQPLYRGERSIKRGDMTQWMNRVIAGDCLQVLQDLPDQSVGMILADLPYGMTTNAWDRPLDLPQLWQQYERIIRKGGVICLTASGLYTAQLIMSNPRLFKYKLVWVKSRATNFLNTARQPLRKHEDVCIFYKGRSTFRPQKIAGLPYDKGIARVPSGNYGDYSVTPMLNQTGERHPTDVFYIKSAATEGRIYHPTQKPVALGRYLIRTYSDEGDTVLDNACGSGSFLVAAVLEGRQFIGIERYPKQKAGKKMTHDLVSTCYQRINEAQQRKELFDGKEETRQPL